MVIVRGFLRARRDSFSRVLPPVHGADDWHVVSAGE